MQALAFLQPVIAGLLTTAFLGAILRALSRTRARAIVDGTQRIRPHPGLLLRLGVGCPAFSGLALHGAIAHAGRPAAWGLGLVFGGFGLAMPTALSPAYDVIWSTEGMQGPASYGMPPFGPRRAEIGFDEIEDLGMDALGSF